MLRLILVFLAGFGWASAARAGDAGSPAAGTFNGENYILAPQPSATANASTAANADAKQTGVHAKIGDIDMSLHMMGGAWAGGVIRP
jgi:hypothetical protein